MGWNGQMRASQAAAVKGVQQTGMQKGIGFVGLFAFSFGTIIGVGWIILLGSWLEGAGSLGAAVAFFGGAIIMILIGLCYGEIASMYPSAGGEFVYTYNIFGSHFAFVIGWFLALIYISVCAFEAVAAGWVISILVPASRGPALYEILGETIYGGSLAIGLILMAVITAVNFHGSHTTARFQNFATAFLVLFTFVFVAIGLYRGSAVNLEPILIGESMPLQITGVIGVLVTTPFWYAGFNVIPQALAERSKTTSLKFVGLVIALSIFAAGVFYVLVIISTSMVISRTEMLSADLPAAAAFEAAFGVRWLRDVVLTTGLLGLITTWNAVYFSGARVLYALGRAHMLPGILSHTDTRFGSPSIAVLFVGFFATALTFVGKGALEPIVNSSGICFAALFLLVSYALFRQRITNPDYPRPFKLPFGMFISVITILLTGALLIYALYLPWKDSKNIPVEWIILGVWAGLGFLMKLLVEVFTPDIDADEQARRVNDYGPSG